MKVFLFIALAVLFVIVCALLCAINSTAQTGAVVGLLFGVISSPVRIAGVDFRQWFRDPGEPSEASDDSPYGLVKDVFYAMLRATALLFFISLLFSRSMWLAPTCQPEDWYALELVNFLRIPALLQTWKIGAFFVDCGGWVDFYFRFPLGLLSGIAVVQFLAEIVWRVGLTLLPQPTLPQTFLAPHPEHTAKVWRPIARKTTRRRLIVCCDGTWNWPDGRLETNVIRLVRAIAPNDGQISQIVYYHQGVGTGNIFDRIVGGGAGVGLSVSVKACYGFLSDNYLDGDEIFLFGFSRGAFVARSIAGVIGTVGILAKAEMENFIEVWDWYSQPKERRQPAEIERLAPRRHKQVDIECIGVWDTVGALGIPGTRFCAQAFAFYETALGRHVHHAFQALAIDERRGNFQAAVWVQPRSTVQHNAVAAAAAAIAAQDGKEEVEQVLRQVWFPGAHSNVGGGYERHGLSDTTFLWMLAQLQPPVSPPLLFLNPACVKPALDHSEPYPTGTLVDSRTMFWRLIGSPVPRPVCLINSSEQVHESAWQRGQDGNTCPVAANDIYRRGRRLVWLAAVLPRQIRRVVYEVQQAVTVREPPVRAPRQVSSNIGFCGRVLQWVGGSG